MKEYPKNESELKRALFILEKMDILAKSYNLSATDVNDIRSIDLKSLKAFAFDYGLKGLAGDLLANLPDYVLGDTADIFADLKGDRPLRIWGSGRCGNWSYAFKQILDGAGIKNAQVVYGAYKDKSISKSSSWGFGNTDTAVRIKDDENDKILDIFRLIWLNKPVYKKAIDAKEWLTNHAEKDELRDALDNPIDL
jgi:hypothetical protein